MSTDARNTLDRLVLDGLREKHGAAAIAQRPLSIGSTTLTIDEPADLVAAMGEAQYLARVAEGLVKDYARKARGAGRAWRELAKPLGVTETMDRWDDPASEAFKFVAHTPSQPYDRLWTSWTCASCGGHVLDYGPYNDPDYDEQGHGDGCARHLADIAEYDRRNGDDG